MERWVIFDEGSVMFGGPEDEMRKVFERASISDGEAELNAWTGNLTLARVVAVKR